MSLIDNNPPNNPPNNRLNTTAGRCVYLRKVQEYRVYIELSPKVVDCLDRMKETLAHELCHAAAFIIDHKMVIRGTIREQLGGN